MAREAAQRQDRAYRDYQRARVRGCWWFNADNALETWHVSADIGDGKGPHAGSHVGDMNITLGRTQGKRNPAGSRVRRVLTGLER